MNRERRKRLLARGLFAAVIAILPVQYYVEHRIGEPYPSLIMPSFAGDNTANGRIQVQSADIELHLCDRRCFALRPDRCFDILPHSHVAAVMQRMFGPVAYHPHPIPHWKKWIVRYVSPGYGKRILLAQGRSPIDESTRQWLSNRIAREYGDKPAIFRVLWYEHAYDVTGYSVQGSRRLIAVVPVCLNSCAR